jgi:hypothetical protein
MEAGVRGSLGGLRHDPFSSLPMRLPHRDLAAGDHFGFLGLTALAIRAVASTTLGFFGCLGLRTSRPPLFFPDIAHAIAPGDGVRSRGRPRRRSTCRARERIVAPSARRD